MRSYGNPISLTSQFYHCSVPFRLDVYRGCAFSCSYCFAFDRNINLGIRHVYPTDYGLLRSIFDKALNSTRSGFSNATVECIRRRVPVHFGGMSDPLQSIEKNKKLSLRTLEMLRDFKYPTILSTKSDLPLTKDYISILKRMKIAVQISLITSNEKIAKRLEPSAPSVRRRLEVIAKLSDSGIWASCRLQPLIPHVNTDDFELIDKLSDAGCKHVIIEHYKLPTYACSSRKTQFRRLCSYDVLKYYRERGARHSKVFLELPSSVKIENLRKLVPRIHSRKMTYGAADNDLHHLGDDVCCCGIGKLSGFESVYKHTFTKAVFDARTSGAIQYSSISEEWSPRGTVRRILDKECRLSSASSVKDFVKMKWNIPFTRNSPTDLFGVRPSGKFDREGNIVYECTTSYGVI